MIIQLQHNLKLLKTKAFLFLFLVVTYNLISQTNTGVILYGGMLANKTMCNNMDESGGYGVTNPSNGGITYSFELGSKYKFSNFFSVELGYQKLQQHITSTFNDLVFYYADNFTHTGFYYAGLLSYTDNVYLYGNHYYIGMNLELTYKKNNFIIGINASQTNYDTKQSYMTRNYTNIQTTAYLPNLDTYYSSKLYGPKTRAFNLNIKYERMLYKNKIGIYSKLYYQLFYRYNYYTDYTSETLGFDSRKEYIVTDRNGGSYFYSNNINFHFNSVAFSIGLFYKFNFKKREKINN